MRIKIFTQHVVAEILYLLLKWRHLLHDSDTAIINSFDISNRIFFNFINLKIFEDCNKIRNKTTKLYLKLS